MKEKLITELRGRAQELATKTFPADHPLNVLDPENNPDDKIFMERLHESYKMFAELIVKEMCGLLEQAEDDVYHCFEPSERPTEYIEWLRDWQERFTKHFGVEE